MYNNIPPQLWMMLPVEIRQHFSKVFDLKQNGVREIIDQAVVNDGHSAEDLRAITLEKLNEYNNAKDADLPTAWKKACEKAQDEIFPKPITIMAESEAGAIEQAEAIIKKIETQKDDNKKSK